MFLDSGKRIADFHLGHWKLQYAFFTNRVQISFWQPRFMTGCVKNGFSPIAYTDKNAAIITSTLR